MEVQIKKASSKKLHLFGVVEVDLVSEKQHDAGVVHGPRQRLDLAA